MRHYPILVAIETDATQFHGEHPHPPALLDRAAAEQVLAHVASDLTRLFPQLRRCSLTMAGGLYDLTQVLRPAHPLYSALESLASQDMGEDYTPRLLSVGAAEGRMPLEPLQPDESMVPGMLQVLPILVSAPDDEASTLFDAMEHRFLEEGQVSAHTAKGLEANFEIRVNHAQLMTLVDLTALLRVQLDHFGFNSLWMLLDAALAGSDEVVRVTSPNGAVFEWDGKQVACQFQTFDYWAKHGVGQKTDAQADERVRAYGNWTREYRQHLVTLGAHGVTTVQHLPGDAGDALRGSFLVEQSAGRPQAGGAQVTEHSSPELGAIAVTVADGEHLLNLYPLRAEGLNDLHEYLRDAGLALGGIAFPAGLRLDDAAERLAQEPL